MPASKTTSAPRGRPSASKATKTTPAAGDGVAKKRGRPAGAKNKRAVEDDEDEDDNSRAAQRRKSHASTSSTGRRRAASEEDDEDDEEQQEEEDDDEAEEAEASRAQGARPRNAAEDQDDGPRQTIPPMLVTRILQEHFMKEDTRITRDANAVVAKYVDVFVGEALARAAQGKRGGFIDVEDLEKISSQLVLDL